VSNTYLIVSSSISPTCLAIALLAARTPTHLITAEPPPVPSAHEILAVLNFSRVTDDVIEIDACDRVPIPFAVQTTAKPSPHHPRRQEAGTYG
jgi:hypothetical protein